MDEPDASAWRLIGHLRPSTHQPQGDDVAYNPRLCQSIRHRTGSESLTASADLHGDCKHFGDRLASRIRRRRSSVCVGLDPRWQQLPEALRSKVDARDAVAVAAATQLFCQGVIDAAADHAAVVKPQVAFFEQLGPAGMTALAGVIDHAHRADMIVLLDGKRGDIGSTAAGYADAWLGSESAWGCDALTVNPYLGDDTLEPFVTTATERGAGIFVLVKTSNPGSGFLQDLATDDGGTLFERVADLTQSLAARTRGAEPYGSVGAVVGATYPRQLAALRARMPNAWLLIPGFGAQGGTADDVAAGFDPQGLGAIVNSSRGIIFAYATAPYRDRDWQDAIAAATRAMAEQLPRPA